jgi:hypothetical protein
MYKIDLCEELPNVEDLTSYQVWVVYNDMKKPTNEQLEFMCKVNLAKLSVRWSYNTRVLAQAVGDRMIELCLEDVSIEEMRFLVAKAHTLVLDSCDRCTDEYTLVKSLTLMGNMKKLNQFPNIVHLKIVQERFWEPNFLMHCHHYYHDLEKLEIPESSLEFTLTVDNLMNTRIRHIVLDRFLDRIDFDPRPCLIDLFINFPTFILEVGGYRLLGKSQYTLVELCSIDKK